MILCWVFLCVVLSVTSGGRVILVVTEGLTETLLNRVPTPAIDALMSQGTIASLKPEFPSETLPTLAAMVTGQHSETTGVLDRLVQDPDGNILRANSDPEFWQYNQNLTNIMELNSRQEAHRTGCILWPGEKVQSSGCDQIWSYDIVVDVASLDNKTSPRDKRETGQDYDFEESDYFQVEETADLKSDQTETGEFFINKTTDQVTHYLHVCLSMCLCVGVAHVGGPDIDHHQVADTGAACQLCPVQCVPASQLHQDVRPQRGGSSRCHAES